MPEKKQSPEVKDSKVNKKPKVEKHRMQAFKSFISETKAELKKIVWPTPSKVINNTLIVIVAIFVIGAFIWIVDFFTSNGLNALLNAFSS